MGGFNPFSKPKTPKGPSASEIRSQEQSRIRKEQLSAQEEIEEKRRARRSRLLEEDEDTELGRKRLLGE